MTALEDPCTLCGRHERTADRTMRLGDLEVPIEECPMVPSGAFYIGSPIGYYRASRFAGIDDVPAYEWRPDETVALPVLSAAALRRSITDAMRGAPSAPLHDPSTCAICTELASLLRSANNQDVPKLPASNFPQSEKGN